MLGSLLLLLAVGQFITRRYYPSLLIFFCFVTNGFLLMPPAVLLAGAPIEKTTDLALGYVVLISLYRLSTMRLVLQRERLFGWILVFLTFVVVSVFHSWLAWHYSLAEVIKVARANLIFLSLGVMLMVPAADLLRVWHMIALITVGQCVLYLLQIPTGMVLLGVSTTVNNMESIGWTRYYNTPTYLTATLFYFLFAYRHRAHWMRWVTLGTLMITVIAPMHRSYMLIVFLIVIAQVLAHQSLGKRVGSLVAVFFLINGALMIGPVQQRFSDGLRDITQTFTANKSLKSVSYGNEDTFGFRVAHFSERAQYLCQEADRMVFGLGMLWENAKQTSKLRFEAGAFDERTGRVAQVDTGDVTWSLTIVQLGFAGTGLLLVVLTHLFKTLYRYRATSLGLVGLLTSAATLLISFTGVELVSFQFRAVQLLFVAGAIKIARLHYQQKPQKVVPPSEVLPHQPVHELVLS